MRKMRAAHVAIAERTGKEQQRVQICRTTALIFFFFFLKSLRETWQPKGKYLILNCALEKIVAIKDSIGIDGKI